MRIAGKINYPIQQQKPLKENTTAYCFIGEIERDFMGDGNVVVGNECGDSLCQPGFNEYKGVIGIRKVKQDYNNINYCAFSSAHVYPPAAGIFKPLFDEELPNSISKKIKDQLLVDFNLEVCYKSNKVYWKYRIPEDSIFLRSILDVCEDNILDGSSEFIIHDLSELSMIPNEEACMALKNFEDQRSYGSGGKYYLIAPVWAHEKVHKDDFQKLINKVLNEKMKYLGNEYRYKDLLSNVFQPECNETINNEAKARFQIKKYLKSILSYFIFKLNEQYKIALANEDNETNTHKHIDVQWKITEYKRALQYDRLKKFWEDCPYKEKDIQGD
ncbi:MAG: hypothetical protein M5U17_02365 [Ignavibacterium sp.]|nr:hypothetical protein [Ignavibacterium sp.]